MGLPTTLDQHDVILLRPLTPRHFGGVVALATMPQQHPPSQMPLQAYAIYAMGPPQVGFSFRVEPPTILYFYMFGVCSGVCFLLSDAMLDAVFIYGGSNIGVCTIATPGAYPLQVYVQPGNGHQPTPGMHRVAAPSTALSSFMLLNQLSPSHPNCMFGHTALGAWQRVTSSLCLPCMVGRGLLFKVWFHQMT